MLIYPVRLGDVCPFDGDNVLSLIFSLSSHLTSTVKLNLLQAWSQQEVEVTAGECCSSMYFLPFVFQVGTCTL